MFQPRFPHNAEPGLFLSLAILFQNRSWYIQPFEQVIER